MRKAIALGITDYSDKTLARANLSIVNDLDRMEKCFAAGGYNSVMMIGRAGGLTKPMLKADLSQAFESVGDVSVLVVYITGHGCSVYGDKLLLRDFNRIKPYGADDDVLERSWINKQLRKIRGPEHIVVFSDSCREELPLQFDRLFDLDSSMPEDPRVVWMYACEPTQRALFSTAGGCFTHAIDDVMSPTHPAATASAVFEFIQPFLELRTGEVDKDWVQFACLKTSEHRSTLAGAALRRWEKALLCPCPVPIKPLSQNGRVEPSENGGQIQLAFGDSLGDAIFRRNGDVILRVDGNECRVAPWPTEVRGASESRALLWSMLHALSGF